MSSILDALNKLEQEKAQAQRERERGDFDATSAAHDLVGKSLWRDRVTLRVSASTLLLSGVLVLVALIAGSMAVVLVALRSLGSDTAVPVTTAATVEAAAESAESDPAPSNMADNAGSPLSVDSDQAVSASRAAKEDAGPVEESVSNAALVQPPADTARPPAPPVDEQNVVAATVEPDAPRPDRGEAPAVDDDPEPPETDRGNGRSAASPPETAPAIESPASEDSTPSMPAVERERVARRSGEPDRPWRARRVPGPSERPEPADEPLERLPVLTPVEQARYGFEQLTINMVKPASETNPQGSAIMTVRELEPDGSVRRNIIPFYEGQRIQRSDLRLFKVEGQGIGLEDVRTGERYRMPF